MIESDNIYCGDALDCSEQMKAKKKFRDLVLQEARKGNIVFLGEGPMVANLNEFIKQPAEGILYDLNRLPEVVLTFIDDPKWINDYAVSLVITKLKANLEAAQQLLPADSILECPSCHGTGRAEIFRR